MKKRTFEVNRRTRETDVVVRLNLDGMGIGQVSTGIVFFDHMLGALAKHGLFDLKVKAKPIGAFDEHHIVEDIAIALGQALDSALCDKKGIRRFGFTTVPMDEALASVSVDISGRGYSMIKASFKRVTISDLSSELVAHFLEAFALNGKFTLHVDLVRGENDHHKAEAIFKALGVALKEAVQIEPRAKGQIPSQKGTLS